MKSDRDFLDGVYAKVEKLTASSVYGNDIKRKEHYHMPTNKQHVSTTRYLKYSGMAAGFLLLISSAIYLGNYKEKNNQIGNTPAPINIRTLNHTDQLLGQATDIVAVEASVKNDVVILNITESYKSSKNELLIPKYLDNKVIGLTDGQLAIVFINTDYKDAPVMDMFLWDSGNNSFINPYGETINEEILNNLY